MAFDAGSIFSRLKLDDSDIKKGFGGIQDGAKKLLESLGPGGKLALGGAAAFAGIAIAAKKALDAFSAQEAAILKLNQALANQGNLTAGVSRSLQQFAGEMQAVSLFGDEVILAAQGQLAAFGANEAQIKTLTPAVLDYAEAMGKDLNSAALDVAKSFAGQTSQLSRLGIDTKSLASESDRLRVIQEGLGQAFGGQALAATKSWGGELTQIKNAAGDVVEEIGKFIRFLMVDFAGGAETSLGVLQSLAGFFGQTLPIVVSEARAIFAEFVAGFLDGIASLAEFGKKIPGFRELVPDPEIIRAVAEGQRALAVEIRDSADAFVLAGGVTEEAENKSRRMTEATSELTKEQKKLHDQVVSMAEQLGTAGLAQQAQIATLAIQELGGAGNVSATGMQSLSGLLDQLRTNAMSLTPELRAIALELDKIALNKGMFEVAKSMEPLPITTEQWQTSLATIPPELDSIQSGITAAFGPDGQALIGGLETKTFDLGTAMSGVNDFLSEARGLFTLLGIEADSVFGKIIGWLSKAFDMFNSLTGIISKVLGLFGKGGGLGNLLGSLGQGAGSLLGTAGGVAAGVVPIGVPGAITGATTGTGAGVGGALGGIGSAVSSGASAVMGGITTALAAIPVAGWVALAGIGVGLLAKKIFGGPSDFEKVGTELGMSVGQGVQFGIVNLFEARGGTIGQAIQLSLGEVIKDQVAQGVANFDLLTEKAADTFSFMERGEISATEGQKALNESVAALLPHLGELGAQGQTQIERLLRAAAATGTQFAGLDQLVAGLGQSLLQNATAGGDAFLNSMNALGVTGRQSLEFIKNLAIESGIQFEGLDQIVALLGGSMEQAASLAGEGFLGTAAALDVMKETGITAAEVLSGEFGSLRQLIDETARAARAFDVPGNPFDGGRGMPFKGAQHGFDGDVGAPFGVIQFEGGVL